MKIIPSDEMDRRRQEFNILWNQLMEKVLRLHTSDVSKSLRTCLNLDEIDDNQEKDK